VEARGFGTELPGPYKELQQVLKEYKAKQVHKVLQAQQDRKEHLLMLKHQ
jgi:hypothetical protein